jgi:serine/threonine protein kinase
MQECASIAHLSSPFEADEHGVARWRKVKGLRELRFGGKEMLVANQRQDDGLGLPLAFVVEKADRKAIGPQAWDTVCVALATMASMDMNHANVVKYYGAWQDNASVYLVSEFCSGSDLFTTVSNGCCGNWRDHARQMLKGLEEFHRTGLLHPGICLEDFVLSDDGCVKLSGCVSWGMGNYSSPGANIRQIGEAIYALIYGEHPPMPYVGATSTVAEDFFKLLLCEQPDLKPSLSSALNHHWLSPSADADNWSEQLHVESDTGVNSL